MPNSGGFETLGFTQLREQQLMGVGHVWPLGLQPPARASALKTSVAMTARIATTSEPRGEKARVKKPRAVFMERSPLGWRAGSPNPDVRRGESRKPRSDVNTKNA
jgi:hypothetical protein